MADFLILEDKAKDKKIQNKEESYSPSLSLIDRINLKLYSMQKVKTENKAIFYRLLSTMVNAGVSLLKSVSILKEQEKDKLLKIILGTIEVDLKEGKKLSEAMSRHPKTFDNAEIGIIKSGEKTGLLNKSLLDLADQIEKLDSINGKIRGALTYPAFIMIVVIGVVVVMMVKVVPGLMEIFVTGEELPASTRILIGMSDFFVAHWFKLGLGLILFLIGFNIWKSTDTGKYLYDSLKMKVPIFGSLIQKMVLSKFARVFAGLVGSGVSVVESLKITAEAVGNEVYKQRIILLSQDVASGIKIWESVDGDKLFPAMMVQMIQVGEQTAKLSETVSKVADFYDDQVDSVIGALNKLLEPMIIVILAVVVGFIAIAIMQPILGLSETVSNM